MKVIWEPGLQIKKMCSSAEHAIVAVNVRQYIDFLGGKWRNHFVTKRQLFTAKELSTNSGNFKTLASNGRLELFNAVTDGVKKVKNFCIIFTICKQYCYLIIVHIDKRKGAINGKERFNRRTAWRFGGAGSF